MHLIVEHVTFTAPQTAAKPHVIRLTECIAQVQVAVIADVESLPRWVQPVLKNIVCIGTVISAYTSPLLQKCVKSSENREQVQGTKNSQ